MAIERDYVKALIDRLSDEQVQALYVMLVSMVWPTEKVSPAEATDIEEGFAEIRAGKGVRAEDAWKRLGL